MRDFGEWFSDPFRRRPTQAAPAAPPRVPVSRERVMEALQRVRDSVGLYAAPGSAGYERQIVNPYIDAIEDALMEMFE